MVKKIIALLAAAILVVGSLTACGEGQGGDTGSDTGGSDTGNVIKVGIAANETGWFSQFDANNILEAKEYVEKINSEGGVEIGGETYQIKLIVADGQSDPAAMRTACQRLVDEKVDIVFETNDFWMTGSNDLLADAGIVQISQYPDFDPNFWPDNDYLLGGCNGSANDMTALMVQCKEMYPDAKTMMFVCNDDGIHPLRYDFVKKLADKYGYELVGELDGVYAPDASEAQLASIATKIAAYQPDVIMGQGIITNICAIYKELQIQGQEDVVCLASCGKSADVFIGILGEEYANNLISTGQGFEPDKNTDLFNELWNIIKDKHGEEVAFNWTGNTCNCLHEAIYTWQQIGSLDPDEFIAFWKNADKIPCVYGDGILGGEETFDLDFNRINVIPTPISVCKDGKGEFKGWFNYTVD